MYPLNAQAVLEINSQRELGSGFIINRIDVNEHYLTAIDEFVLTFPTNCSYTDIDRDHSEALLDVAMSTTCCGSKIMKKV